MVRGMIHTRSGLRKFLVSALNQRKHIEVIDENMDGSIVVNCDIPIGDSVKEFQIDIQEMGTE